MPFSIDALPRVIQVPLGTTSIAGKLVLRNPTGTVFTFETGFVDAVTSIKLPAPYSGILVGTVPSDGTPFECSVPFPPPNFPAVKPYMFLSGGVATAFAPTPTLISEVVIITGQSNDYHSWSLPDPLAPTPDPQALMMTPVSGGWVTPTGALITFCNALRRHLQRAVAIVVTAMPSIGTTRASTVSGDYWNDTAGATFTQHAAMIAAAGGDFSTWLMSGCESDGVAVPAVTPAMLYDGLTKLRNDTLALMTPMYGGAVVRPRRAVHLGVNLIGSLATASPPADSARVRSGQMRFAQRRGFAASWSDDLAMDGVAGSVHYSVASLVLRAERMALGIARGMLG